jgi:enamine deaminase RidA (YjgF/YER057c/UK114 family)
MARIATHPISSVDMGIEERLTDMGLELLTPLENPSFKHGVIVGNTLFTSAHSGGPIRDGAFKTGRVGAELTLEEGIEGAQTCMLLVLGRAKAALGDLDRIVRIVKLSGYVSCAPDFYGASQVMNGASDLLRGLWGDDVGVGARTTVTVPHLSGNNACEVELIAEVRD